jgi:hypothetical protein
MGVLDPVIYMSQADQLAMYKFRHSEDKDDARPRDGSLSEMIEDRLMSDKMWRMKIGKGKAIPETGAGGGGGGTHIQKVEIVVSSNQDPSHIARVVGARLSELARHPRASRSVPNYSASRT